MMMMMNQHHDLIIQCLMLFHWGHLQVSKVMAYFPLACRTILMRNYFPFLQYCFEQFRADLRAEPLLPFD